MTEYPNLLLGVTVIGATSLIVTSTDGTIQQNSPSTYNPATQTISVDLSAVGAGTGGIRQAQLLNSAVNIAAGQSLTITLTWNIPFVDTNYIVTATPETANNQEVSCQYAAGSKTETTTQFIITNNGTQTITTLSLDAIAKELTT